MGVLEGGLGLCNSGCAGIHECVKRCLSLLEVEFGALTCQITLGGAPVVLDFDLFVVDFGLAELIGQIAEVELRKN